MKQWKFEQVLTILLLVVLSMALVVGMLMKIDKLIEWIVPALITAFVGLVSFFQTKHKPGQDENTKGSD